MRCTECNVVLSPDDNMSLQLCADCEILQMTQDNIFEVRRDERL